MIIFVVLSTVIGLGTIQDYSSNENESVIADFSSPAKTTAVEISDGVGSSTDIGE